MANITTVTRPYAKAILALAREQNDYDGWTKMLELLAGLVNDAVGFSVLSNLAITPAEKIDFINSVGQDMLTPEAKALVKILAHVKRLLILPELLRLFEEMRKQAQGIVQVDFTVAQPIDAPELNRIKEICAKEFNEKAIVAQQVDSTLIGGGMAQIGNRVIDASIAGRLIAMRNLLRG